MVALYLRLLADGAPPGLWVPMKHARNAVAATAQVSSKPAIRDHLSRAEDMELLERERRGNNWYVRLLPLGHDSQFIPCLDLDQARQLVPPEAQA